MKKNFYSALLIVCLPLMGMPQEKQKQEKKENVIVITPNTQASMLLYVINDRYYLGDTVDILIPQLDATKIKQIRQIKDKDARLRYTKKTGKFSGRIRDIFIVETEEDFDSKINKR